MSRLNRLDLMQGFTPVDRFLQSHRYSFDLRVTPIWLAYAALDAYVLYYNYLTASGYMGESFKKCFEESYCFAVIELVNRNLGPFTALLCTMFYGRRYKVAALAGTERVLAFIRETDQDAAALLSPAAKYYSAAVIVAYCGFLYMYTVVQPVLVMAMFCVNALGQTTLYNLAMFQYYVLGCGYARVNRLLEASAARPLADHVARLTDTFNELGRQVDNVNRGYALGLLLRLPYSIVRIVMLVFRIIEYAAVARADRGHPMSRVAITLIVEHVCEILMFLQQLVIFCVTGTRLSDEANKTLASLQKLKLHHGSQQDLNIKKNINIFWIQACARKVNATIGGFVFINMDLMKAICGIIATYFLVLIQFKSQKGISKPLHLSD
ncbi:uncharacterized protein LOC132926826 [Rhopalosiphum padi]|uniref:uncharacterized protein LOC132926826 n=1 Tax=Rhopalosiphum padi TaxID=40932 RepID=UPI00298D60D0|nr:uncharacterized protein LOC132926826 [Rhopalosiphum padi]